MALWGKKDAGYSDGTIAVSGTTVTGTGTTFTTAGISTGSVITVGTGTTYGEAIITAITANNKITITSGISTLASAPVGTVPAGAAYDIQEKPISTTLDTNYAATEIYGVSVEESQAAREDKSQYKPASSGWVGITTYLDQHGSSRVKTETLVAGGGDGFITGDAGDDTILPDS